MPRVYSSLLAVVQGLASPVEFSAPVDRVVVIRDVDVYWGGGLSAGVSFRLMGSAGQTIWEVHVNPSTPPYDSQTWQWRGRQVIPPGDTWAISGAGGAFDAAVSGYLLTAV